MTKQAVILAGGQGTRLKPFTDENPKPLFPIHGKPFLFYLIEQLKGAGIVEVVLLLGYKAEKIVSAVAEMTERDFSVSCFETPVEYDTGSRIRAVRDCLQDEFLLLYCDNYCPIDLRKAYDQFHHSKNLIQITVYSNTDGYTKNNLTIQDGQILVYDKKRMEAGLNAVDIGYAFMKKEVLSLLPEDGNLNFEVAVYPQVISKCAMGGFLTEHRYYSIGSWKRIELTKEFFRDRKVVFLDRDGTLNVRPPKAEYIEKPEDFVWLPKAKDAVRCLKENGYEIYLITNQPGIARRRLTKEELDTINEKMLRELRDIGADIDSIYICPHGWDEGCDCRKPKPGMLYQAQKEHSLNLSQCILIGDDERDIEAGEAAGVQRNILVTEQYSLWDAVQEIING